MKTNELRIGNYLLWDNQRIFKVSTISPLGVRFDNDHNQFRAVERCYPIPLTPETLEKCGFEIVVIGGDSYTKIYEYNKIQIIVRSDNTKADFYYNRDGNFFLHAYFLHQLQNLFFALTQKELIISL